LKNVDDGPIAGNILTISTVRPVKGVRAPPSPAKDHHLFTVASTEGKKKNKNP